MGDLGVIDKRVKTKTSNNGTSSKSMGKQASDMKSVAFIDSILTNVERISSALL